MAVVYALASRLIGGLVFSAAIGGIAAIAMTFVAFYVVSNLPVIAVVKVWAPVIGILIAFTAALGVPTAVLAKKARFANLHRDICRGHMELISTALREYENRTGGKVPLSLEDMVAANYLEPASIKCPRAAAGEAVYLYLPPVSVRIAPPAAVIVACDRGGSHGDMRIVLTLANEKGKAAMSAAWMEESAFQAALKRPENAEFAKIVAADVR